MSVNISHLLMMCLPFSVGFFSALRNNCKIDLTFFSMFYFLFRSEGHTDLGYRLIELMFELTDRLTFYLCGRRPGKS